MNKIFAIIYCFAPILVPATLRYLKWFKGLDALGYKIDTLSIDPDSFDPPGKVLMDSSLTELVPPSLTSHTVWSIEKNMLLKLIKENRIGHILFYKLFEQRKIEWYLGAKKFLKRYDSHNIDVIFSSSKMDSSHVVGLYLKNKTQKPWIAYFSDPWVGNPYTAWPSKKIYRYNCELEKKVVESADMLLFPTEEMVHLALDSYPEQVIRKARVLPHCFVPEWYTLSTREKLEEKGKKVRVVHAGNFYGPRTPLPLLRNLVKLKNEIKDISEKIEFQFYGGLEEKYKSFIYENKLDDVVSILGSVPYMQSLNVMKNADYLIMIDAPLTSTKESVFLPLKLIDYIGSYNPVIGLTPEKGASATVLKKTGNIPCDVGHDDAIREVLKRLVEHVVIKPKRDAIDAYNYKTVTKNLSDFMTQVAGNGVR